METNNNNRVVKIWKDPKNYCVSVEGRFTSLDVGKYCLAEIVEKIQNQYPGYEIKVLKERKNSSRPKDL